ncbi:MAG TPA: guanylate kinase, partial [Geobacterales bacterium]|nr:guanylate kinase [Geobacterales bacterium]
SPRAGEVNGLDYHFVTAETFRQMVAQGGFAEWAEVHGNFYGTAVATLQEAMAAGLDLILDIDCQGAAQLRQSIPDSVSLFILPPSMEELRRRLQGRGTDSSEVVERRMKNAVREIGEASAYDFLIVNDRFDEAVVELTSIIRGERRRTSRVLPEIAPLFPTLGEVAKI